MKQNDDNKCRERKTKKTKTKTKNKKPKTEKQKQKAEIERQKNIKKKHKKNHPNLSMNNHQIIMPISPNDYTNHFVLS